VDQKVAGEQVTVAPEAPRAHVIDLFEALKQSLAKEGAKEGPPLKPPKKAKETGTAAEGARPRRGRKRSAS